MADISTPILNLVKPEVGVEDPTKEWGEKINENLDKIDTFAGEVIKRATYRQLLNMPKTEGFLYYATDQQQWYGWDGTTLRPAF